MYGPDPFNSLSNVPMSFDKIRRLFPGTVDEEFIRWQERDTRENRKYHQNQSLRDNQAKPHKRVRKPLHTKLRPRLHNHKATNILYTLRAAKGISQAELATTAGVNRQTINEIENLRSAPSVYTVIAIAQTLGIKIEDIFKLRD